MGIIKETSCFGNFEQLEEPKVLIIPTPYEYTSSYCKGTKNGPQAILNASSHLEKFDDELWADISKIGINTSEIVNCEFVSDKSTQPFCELEEIVRNAVIGGCLPVVIGGEHSISYGSVKAVYDLFPDVSILYFDAHASIRENFQNNKFSHLSSLRQIYETMPDLKIIHLGARSISEEEADWLEENSSGLEIFFAREKNQWQTKDIIENLTKNVYISFDFSALDLSIMPSCITPEPDGLAWEQSLDIIRNVCAFKEIVGIDFTGLAPVPNLNAPDFLAAKLIYKTIGYAFARQLGIIEESKPAFAISES